MRAVEDADLAGFGQGPSDPPEEGVRALLGGRRLEAPDAAARGVEMPDDVLDRAALAAGVHALEDQQDPAAVTRRARGPQAFLQVGEAFDHLEDSAGKPGGLVARTGGVALASYEERSTSWPPGTRSRWRSGRGPALALFAVVRPLAVLLGHRAPLPAVSLDAVRREPGARAVVPWPLRG